MSDDLVSGWSCDQRHRGNGCRDPHGCHCREITAQNADIAIKDLAVAEAARSMHKLMARALAAESELSTLRDMLVLCGELGGLGKDETPAAYLRRLIDEVAGVESLRARVREVVGPFADNMPRLADVEAARQLMEEVK